MSMNDKANKNIVDFQNLIKRKENGSLNVSLIVDRSQVFEDSYNQLKNKEKDLFLGKFNIRFKDEAAIDVGSVTKEWIVLLMKDIVTKLFSCSSQNYYYPSKNTSELPDFQNYFEFSGKIFALALIHNVSINVRFSTFFLKHILRIPIDFEDIKSYDENLYKSLIYLQENEANNLDLYFETSIKTPGGFTDVELIPNGGSIKVTNENKKEYIDTLVNYLLAKSIQQQIDAFCRGFDSLIPHNEIENITIGDLEYLISGPGKIDVNDLIKRIKVEVHNQEDSQAVQLFFDAISKWNNNYLEKLLMFVTGCYTVPLSGEIFTIGVDGRNESLPIAHTSFNRLVLPKYTSEEQLNKKFELALDTSYFGLI